MKKRSETESESHKLKTRLRTLKMEEEKVWKKVESTKKALSTLENARKNVLENKIIQEENKQFKEKEYEKKKTVVIEKTKETKEFLKNWKTNLAVRNHEEQARLKEEKRKIERRINIDKQEEEERNKQLCIKVKNSKITYLDNKLKAIQKKKDMLKKDLLSRISMEVKTQKDLTVQVDEIKKEQSEIKKNLETLESTNLDEGKFKSIIDNKC